MSFCISFLDFLEKKKQKERNKENSSCMCNLLLSISFVEKEK